MSPVPATASGERRHRVTLDNPGASVPDGDGGYTTGWAPLTPPTMYASIAPATAASLERTAASTVIATATHVIRMPYHAGVTTQTRLTVKGRTFNVIGRVNLDERDIELVLVCAEVVP